MKKLSTLLLLSLLGFLTSCGNSGYFIKQVDEDDPHASLALRNGTTQIVKIDGKYAREDAGHTVRLKPGQHVLEISHQAQQAGFMSALIGLPGNDISTQTTMDVDLVPGKAYRPECNVSGPRGATFYLVDQTGLRTNFTRAYSRAY